MKWFAILFVLSGSLLVTLFGVPGNGLAEPARSLPVNFQLLLTPSPPASQQEEPTSTPIPTLTPQGSPTATFTPSLTPIAYPGCNDPYEPNEHFGDPIMITSGQVITSFVCGEYDNDYYGFELVPGSVVNVALTSLPLDYFVELYNPNFERMKSSNKPGVTSEFFTFDQVIQPGIWRVRVSGFLNVFDVDDPYRLVIDWSMPAVPTPTPTRTPTPTNTFIIQPSFVPTATSTPTPSPTPTQVPLNLPFKVYLPGIRK